MNHRPTNQEIVLNSKDCFAIYRLPGMANSSMIRQHSPNFKDFNTEFESGNTGFVLHPFHVSSAHQAYFIQADEIIENPNFSFCSNFDVDRKNLDENSYLKLAQSFISACQKDFDKIILSRIKTIDYPGGNIAKVFHKLCIEYPNAFVSLVNIPDVGSWMGATPEVLLNAQNNVAQTMALAGTQPVNNQAIAEVKWGRKEQREQALVANYINEILEAENIEFLSHGPFTMKAGKVFHLNNKFTFSLNNNFHALTQKLHPSPAVCGLPKSKAYQFIQENESHSRGYYCGFLGPVHLENSSNLYVNLRCMEVMEDKMHLYLGGGITAESDPKKEFEETELKATTLLSVIEKCYSHVETVE